MGSRVALQRETSFSHWERIIERGVPLITLKPIAEKIPQEILIIYGGSREAGFRKVVKKKWAENLVHRGFTVHCFDFRSNVEGNDFYQFGLWDRLIDTQIVINQLMQQMFRDPLTLVGVSMGGHIATQIASELGNRLANLVLVAPAAYHDTAIRPGLKFSPPGTAEDHHDPRGEFTRILQQSEKWRESSIFSLAQQVKACPLIIYYLRDEVVGEVPLKYLTSFLRGGLSPEFTTIDRDHRGSFTHPQKIKLVLDHITDFLKSSR